MLKTIRMALCASALVLAFGGAGMGALLAQAAPQTNPLYHDVPTDDAAAQAVARFAASQTGEDNASLRQLLQAKRNTYSSYRTEWWIDFTMDNGSHFTAEVRDNRDGSYTLINIDNQDE